MFWGPMLIVWIIMVGVVICVSAAVVVTRLRGESIGMNPFTVVAIVIFCTGLLGFFVTGFASPTPQTWWQAPLVRVIWQLGGAVFVAIMVLIEGDGEMPVRVLAVVFLAVGVASSFNPLRDLIQGPLLLRGKPDLNVVKTHNNARGGAAIWANLRLTAPDGSQHEIDMAGWGATEAIDKLQGCEDAENVELLVLRHLERVLDAHCE